jgi:6-pyruvoyltetrahydropterin/6-carboxytetrahydropterin synthase
VHASLTKTIGFESAHFLPTFPQDHKCRRMHGHSFRVDVTITGKVDPDAGYLMDFGELSALLRPIVDRLDHRVLNDIPGLENPTAELVAKYLWDALSPDLPLLEKVLVRETCTSAAAYAGPRKPDS